MKITQEMLDNSKIIVGPIGELVYLIPKKYKVARMIEVGVVNDFRNQLKEYGYFIVPQGDMKDAIPVYNGFILPIRIDKI